MCPQFRCNYHSACTIRASLPELSPRFPARSLWCWERKGTCLCEERHETLRETNCQSEWCFLAVGQWRRPHVPLWLAVCLAHQWFGFCWQRGWQRGCTGPIRNNSTVNCILTLADLISRIKRRAKTKGVIMIAVSYYGIDLLTRANTHTHTE